MIWNGLLRLHPGLFHQQRNAMPSWTKKAWLLYLALKSFISIYKDDIYCLLRSQAVDTPFQSLKGHPCHSIRTYPALGSNHRDYEKQYKPGTQQAHADACSRLPLPETPSSVPIPGDTILLINHLNSIPVKASQIALWTQRDPVLSTVTKYVIQGWPSKPTNDAQKPHYNHQQELSVEGSCLLWGNRVIIPLQSRKLVLEELHIGHPGIERMKRLARSYLWLPGLDDDIEQKVKSCIPCQSNKKLLSTAPLHLWEWPCSPWSRIHVDYAGPFLGKMFLLIVDSHSKWVEVHVTTGATAATTIDKLQITFAALGLP